MYLIRLQNCAFFACHGVLDFVEVTVVWPQ